MTTDVLAFKPEDTVQTAAQAMSARSIGGAPVVDADGEVVGILNDDDLIVSDVRLHMPTVISVLGAYLELPSSAHKFDEEVKKAVGSTVGDVMTKDPETCTEDATVEEVATTLHQRQLSRLPVVRDGKLVGIVSRANLVRALATTKSAPATIADPGDRAIGDQLLAELRGKKWVDISSADIIVRDRVVHLWFSDDQSREERLTFRVAAENIPGVLGVEEHIVATPALEAAPESGEGQT
jgi:CBS domain-containing protein